MLEQVLTLALSIPNIGSTLLTVFGIGLVIFVHEFGHFLCARKIGVRVEIFSLGYGPRLFGWIWRGTDYRVSAVPVGGYVKMAGSEPNEIEGLPDELLSRTVGERIVIFSGGVVMNILFALIAFPLIFSTGVPMEDARVGAVVPGGPAWKAGVRAGDEILAVNGRDVIGFSDVALEIAFSDPAHARLQVRRGESETEFPVRPEYDSTIGSYVIRITPPQDYRMIVAEGGPAARAAIANGDRLVAIEGQPVGPRAMRQIDRLDTRPLRLTIEREDGSRHDAVVTPDVGEKSERPLIGILPLETRIAALRGAFIGGSLREGEELRTIDGRPVFSSDDIATALSASPAGAPCTIRVARDGIEREVTLRPDQKDALLDDVAFGNLDGPVADGVPVTVQPESPAARAGLANGVRIRAVDGVPVPDYSKLRELIQDADGAAVKLTVSGASGEQALTVTPQFQHLRDYGFEFDPPYVIKQFGIGKAFVVGMHASWNFARQTVLALRKMMSREIDPKNMGGIVAISHASYSFAQLGLAKLFYFLAMLSINLAIINFLPIPLLDGGQVLFLLIEKVKGSPVSDRVTGYSQIVGLVIILSLLIFVTYNDIARLL